MKRSIIGFTVCLLMACMVQVNAIAQTANPTATGARITFAEKSHDFGDIKQGDKVNYTFKFTNTGTQPLIIAKVETTCGCTATNWTKDPVAPGQSGELSATFNSTGKRSIQRKVIKIYSNATNPEETVTIVTNVLPVSNEQ